MNNIANDLLLSEKGVKRRGMICPKLIEINKMRVRKVTLMTKLTSRGAETSLIYETKLIY